jgi:tetratricopeptide (TPR) repeat protein
VELQKSLELNPDFLVGLSVLGMVYADKGMYEEAITAIKKASNINPKRKFLFAIIYGKAGRKEEALAIAAELESRVGPKETWRLALIYAAIGDKDKTFYWLDEAVEKRAPYILWFMKDGNFDYLQDDPRYDELARRLNLIK